MTHEAANRDTRMTALHNVTVHNGSRRGSRIRRGSLIDEAQTDRLTTNRNLLLKNVTATPSLLRMCETQGVITASQREVIESAEDEGDKRMLLLLNSMQMQETTVFRRFCEVLTMSGHPLIADYLRDSGLASRTYTYDDLWEQMPSLNKHLHKWEKERLTEYITSKVKEEVMRFNIGEMQEDREKEVDMRLKQVQQSWKFQKDMKDKESALTSLQNRVIELEKLLVDKEQDAAKNRMNMQRDIKKLSSNVQVAAKFNMANDNALRRLQEAVNLYTAFGNHLESRLGVFDAAAEARRRKAPLLREETSLEGLQKELDTGRRIEYLQQLVGMVLAEVERLRAVERRHEVVLDAAHFLLQQMHRPGTPDGEECAAALRAAFADLVLRHEEQLGLERAATELMRRFVRGELAEEETPDELRGLRLPGAERDELNARIAELEAEVERLRSLPRSVQPSNGPVATYRHIRPLPPPAAVPAPAPAEPEPKKPPTQTYIPFSYHSRRAAREPKPRPDPRPNAKTLNTRVVNFM